MTRIALILAALTAANATATAAQAGNAGDGLGACYNHVISACNQNSNHPVPCSEAGMDACDDLHGANAQPAGGIKAFKTPGTREGMRFRVEATGRTFPQSRPDAGDEHEMEYDIRASR